MRRVSGIGSNGEVSTGQLLGPALGGANLAIDPSGVYHPVDSPRMKTLLSERFAPTTSRIAFVHLDLDSTVEILAGWRRGLGLDPNCQAIDGDLPGALGQLEPLTIGARPRELLVETDGGWTAYFDCGHDGTDPIPAVLYLTHLARCDGLAITCVPTTRDQYDDRRGRLGAVQFELVGPKSRTHFLDYVRSVWVNHDGDRWTFGTNGAVQPFEEQERYRARKVRDRFTSDMLERYCRAIGINPFEASAYGPRGVVVRTHHPVGDDGTVMSLQEAQARLAIVPGEADELEG